MAKTFLTDFTPSCKIFEAVWCLPIFATFEKFIPALMENFKLVLRGDLNQNGYLYGGNLLKWIDEYAWIAATLDYPGSSFVTVALDNVTFKKSVREGAILKFVIERSRAGNTSAQYFITVYCHNNCASEMEPVFSTHVTFVNVDKQGIKTALPPLRQDED